MLLWVILFTFSPGAFASDPSAEPDSEETIRRTVRAVRVSEPLVIDGRLNEPAWKLAPDGGPLIQSDPDEGAEPTERTEFRVLYDNNAIYVGVWCFDSEPDKILARQMARDTDVYDDDFTAIVFDTFLDRRNGYEFLVNPNGARYDALITANRSMNSSWDTIWTAGATIDDEGWKAEFRIPFSSISFDPKAPAWGFNISRRIKRKSETNLWTGARAELKTYSVSEAGNLVGLAGLEQGIGLDIRPYLLSRYTYDRQESDEDTEFTGGGDIRYHITPNLTASVSYNTDFAETEVDSRQINLTRFPLFFPEKREFFLEDSGIFSFGGLGYGLIPFFSRRMGLSADGEPVPIIVAGKLTGRVNSFNLGFINTLIDKHDGLGERNAFVSRISKNIFDQSSIGGILTYGDPNSMNDNVLIGGDFKYFTSSFLGDQVLEANLFTLGTYTEGVRGEDNMAFGAELELPNNEYDIDLEARQIDENFNPALGFAPRKSIRVYEGDFSYRPRPESIDAVRQFFFTYSNYHITDLSDRLESAEHSFTPLFVRFESYDEIFFKYEREFDAPDEDFEISDGVVIPSGGYWWDTYLVGFETASKRPFELEFFYKFGEFYDGDRSRYSAELELKLIKYFRTSFGYSLNKIKLPGGRFDTQLSSARAQVNFTPDLTWFNLVQYDSVSDSVGYNSRVQWEFSPGDKVYLVLNQNIGRTDSRWDLLQTEVTLKLGMTFRF